MFVADEFGDGTIAKYDYMIVYVANFLIGFPGVSEVAAKRNPSEFRDIKMKIHVLFYGFGFLLFIFCVRDAFFFIKSFL